MFKTHIREVERLTEQVSSTTPYFTPVFSLGADQYDNYPLISVFFNKYKYSICGLASARYRHKLYVTASLCYNGTGNCSF